MFTELGPFQGDTGLIHYSSAPPTSGAGLEYKSYSYARLTIAINDATLQRLVQVCLDGGCGMSLIDQQFLETLSSPPVSRQQRSEPVEVQGIGGARHRSLEFVTLTIYVPGTASDDLPAVAAFTRDFHIVPELKCKLLIGNDISGPEAFIVDFGARTLLMPLSGQVSAPVEILRPASKPSSTPRFIQAATRFTIPANSFSYVPISTRMLDPRIDYEFEPFSSQTPPSILRHAEINRLFIDATVTAIPISNHSPFPLVITKHAVLGSTLCARSIVESKN
ncbi:hypothetical protein BJ508DRAFT_312411 [Ascobolus immersus RN42]|uniref:Peptidase A2 domain-containing protein n=1 Tax=Ascobolus immersus RN42 TaxID=1160509 RepID=A0A3N4HMD7_ASCIM|nr:hypothetical protein BJ508DRAFT_312411 [Ascobolus immersus RN42]